MSSPNINLSEVLAVSAELLEQTIKYAQDLQVQLAAQKQVPPVILEKVASVNQDRLTKSLGDMLAAGLIEASGVTKIAAAIAADPNTLLDVVDRLTALHSLSDIPSGVGIRKESSQQHMFARTRRDEDPDGWYKMREGS